jgi:23S rRNA (guanosine2251-2'-O)-methyltransferase
MKKSSKNNYSGKNSKVYKKSLNSNFYSKIANSTKKNYKFSTNSSNDNHSRDLNENDKNKSNFSSLKRRNPTSKSNIKVTNKFSDNNFEQANKRNFDDWIWGKHSVFEALISNRAINRIWCTSEIFSSEKFYILFKDLKSKGVLIEEVSWNRISQLTFGASHQGIALQLACSNTISLEKLINYSKKNSSNPIILALDGITDPHNVGAIIRSAEAFDCKGIIIPQRRSAGLTGTVAKVAAGALEHLPLSISRFNEKSPMVVIVGSEDKGISLLTQKKCDYLLKIPLRGKTSSLNASVAAAISIFHLTAK